jgi:hypothetical protein
VLEDGFTLILRHDPGPVTGEGKRQGRIRGEREANKRDKQGIEENVKLKKTTEGQKMEKRREEKRREEKRREEKRREEATGRKMAEASI